MCIGKISLAISITSHIVHSLDSYCPIIIEITSNRSCPINNFWSLYPIITKFSLNVYGHNISDKCYNQPYKLTIYLSWLYLLCFQSGMIMYLICMSLNPFLIADTFWCIFSRHLFLKSFAADLLDHISQRLPVIYYDHFLSVVCFQPNFTGMFIGGSLSKLFKGLNSMENFGCCGIRKWGKSLIFTNSSPLNLLVGFQHNFVELFRRWPSKYVVQAILIYWKMWQTGGIRKGAKLQHFKIPFLSR